MTCSDAQQYLSQAIDQALTSAEEEQLKAHLRLCVSCRREQAALQTAWGLLDALPVVQMSPDFRTRFWARIREEEVNASPWWARILAPKLIPTACCVSLWLFGISTGVHLFESRFHQPLHLSTEMIDLFAETYPAGSFSQFILERHAR